MSITTEVITWERSNLTNNALTEYGWKLIDNKLKIIHLNLALENERVQFVLQGVSASCFASQTVANVRERESMTWIRMSMHHALHHKMLQI